MQDQARTTHPSDTPLRVAVIGGGFISEYHVDGLRAAGGAEVTVLVGRDPDRTRQRADALGIPEAATDADAVCARPDVDAVVIATPDITHKPLAIAALRAGKPILLQKPMAMTSAESAAIIAVAEESGVRTTVSFMHRYFPEVRWLRERIGAGTFGAVHFIRMRNATPGADWADWFFDGDHVAGGVVMQLGVHGIDLLQHLFGPISAVSARSSTFKPNREMADGRTVVSALEDNVLAAYEFAGGSTAGHEMSFTEVAGCDRFRLEVYFENASVWLRSDMAPAIVNEGSGWQTVELDDEPLGKSHHEHWISVAAGREPADDTAASGLSTMVVGEHIYRSARERRWLSINAPETGGRADG